MKNLFSKLFNNKTVEHIEIVNKKCKRCHKLTTLDELGYCKECSLLKHYIEDSTTKESKLNINTPNVQKMYQYIKTASAYDISKINVDNAEIVDSLSGIEKKFLDYVSSKPISDFEIASYWIYQYFIDCNYLISKFLKNGYLKIEKNKTLEYFNVNELKEILKDSNLKVSGSKAELIKRIEENLNSDKLDLILENCPECYVLTQKGKEIVKGVKNSISEDVDMEEECYELILENRLNEAYQKICIFENKKLVKRGMHCDWSNMAKIQFHLYIDTPLPFKIPESLMQYEKELKATAIYAQMLGVNPIKATNFFCNRYQCNTNKQVLSEILNSIYSIAQGVVLPNSIILELENIEKEIERRNNVPQSYFDKLSIEEFIKQVELKMKQAGISEISYDQLKDGTYNFTYKTDIQIGRIKFSKRSSKMQILTRNTVKWIENQTMEVYLENITKWVEYAKSIKF